MTMIPGPLRPVIHWVSPVPPAQTDIAHYTARILPALAKVARVILWSDNRQWDKGLERHALVRHFDADLLMPRDLARAARLMGAPPAAPQAVFIHIGNAWVFHANLLRLARRLPSIVVLHDLAIQEMMNDAIRNRMFDAQIYRTEMAQWYGSAGAEAAAACLEDVHNTTAHKIAPDLPGFELALPAAQAVLAHTPAAVAAVKGRELLPVHDLELPFNPTVPAPSAARTENGPLRFVQFGYIGPNRRLLQVLEALAALPAEIAFRFDIMGNVWDPALIEGEVARHGLQDRVTLHGFVPEPDLDQALQEAHLVFNLRHPTLGEASGSQLRIWNAKAASVVRRAGWYATLPEDTVFHIPDDNDGEVAALVDLITQLHQDRSLITPIQEQGHARLWARHHPDIYAKQIAQLIADREHL